MRNIIICGIVMQVNICLSVAMFLLLLLLGLSNIYSSKNVQTQMFTVLYETESDNKYN